MAATRPCPCGRLDKQGRVLLYSHCCGLYHPMSGLFAPDACSLMRSRYSAFVLCDLTYLRWTWHPSTCPHDLAVDPEVKWLGLEVRRVVSVDEHHAQVEFVARSRVAGRGCRLHEVSRFVREGGQWFYVDGDLLT